jgi:hypothetical protein
MTRITTLLFAVLLPLSAAAEGIIDPVAEDPVSIWSDDRTVVFDAAGLDLDAFQWIARPVIVFADTPNDPRFAEQMELLLERVGELADRDVVIVTDTESDRASMSAIRQRLRPRGFMLVIMGKDGEVEIRKPSPWSVREISRTIDKMPLRQQEIRARTASPVE